MLVVRLKEKPNLFLPVEYRVGRDGEPVAVRHSLGWTVIGPVGGGSYTADCSANLLLVVENSLTVPVALMYKIVFLVTVRGRILHFLKVGTTNKRDIHVRIAPEKFKCMQSQSVPLRRLRIFIEGRIRLSGSR